MARILLLLTAPAWRGSGVSFTKIGCALQDAGHEVTAVVRANDVATGMTMGGIRRVIRVDLPDSGFRSGRRLAACQREYRWDLAIADSPRDVRLASAAGIAPVIWRFNLPNRQLPADLWTRWRFRGVRCVVYQSRFAESVARTGARWLGMRPHRIIANGYDVAALTPDPARAAAWRTAHGIAPEAPLVVTIGALSPEKALPQTLAVGEALVAAFPGLRQVLVGGGEDADALRERAGGHLLLTGAVDALAAQDAMRAADVLLQLSPREMFPNVVAEGMSLGAAIVGAASGATPEVIGEAGMLEQVDDLAGLVAITTALLKDPARRRMLGEAARHRVGAEFSLERMAREYVAMVASVLATPG